jgi:hypothetical protein
LGCTHWSTDADDHHADCGCWNAVGHDKSGHRRLTNDDPRLMSTSRNVPYPDLSDFPLSTDFLLEGLVKSGDEQGL